MSESGPLITFRTAEQVRRRSATLHMLKADAEARGMPDLAVAYLHCVHRLTADTRWLAAYYRAGGR